jgi:hypothetical protein
MAELSKSAYIIYLTQTSAKLYSRPGFAFPWYTAAFGLAREAAVQLETGR